jgi:hypothetical protein
MRDIDRASRGGDAFLAVFSAKRPACRVYGLNFLQRRANFREEMGNGRASGKTGTTATNPKQEKEIKL